MEFKALKYEKEDGFVTITLNRPERLNAMNRQMMMERNLAFREVLKDKEVSAFIITGAPRPDGRPCFSAGADLKEDGEGVPRWDNSDLRGPAYLEEDRLFPSNTVAGMRPAAVQMTKMSCRAVFDRHFNEVYLEALEMFRVQLLEPDHGDGWGVHPGLAGAAGQWVKNKKK